MGQCTSCEAHRISSVPHSPEVEFPPKSLINHQLLSTTRKGGDLGSRSLEDPSTEGISSTDPPLLDPPSPPIRGIRKLNPRRRHFFFFHHKPRVTFLSPEAELIQSQRSLITTPSKRVHLHPNLPESVKTRSLPNTSASRPAAIHQDIKSTNGKDSSTSARVTTETSVAIMGNNIQKPSRKDASRLKKSSKLATPEVLRLSKSSPFGFGSTSGSSLGQCATFKASTSVGDYIHGGENNNQRVQLISFGHAPPSSFNTSDDVLSGSSALSLSPATVEQLNTSRQEKNSLRARFFSESPPALPPAGAGMNKFGFKGTSTTAGTGGGVTAATVMVPPKGLRTFKYQPPAPTQVAGKNSSAAGSSVGTGPLPPPAVSSSLTQLPNLNFVSAKLPQSKSAAALGGPPSLSFPRKYNFSSESVPEGVSVPPAESQRSTQNHGAGGVANANVETNRDRTNGTHRGGFGWVKSSSTYATTAESQVVKPVPTKPFFLLGSSTAGFPGGVSTGVVSSRKFLFESRDNGQGQPNQRNFAKVTSTKAADPNGNGGSEQAQVHHQVTLTNDNEGQRPGGVHFKIGPTPTRASTSATITRVSLSSLTNLNVDGRLPPSEVKIPELVTGQPGSTRVGEADGVNLNSFSSTTSKSEDSLGEVQHASETGYKNAAGGAGNILGQGAQGQPIFTRPRSGRSQSRERDNPISDSEYLIDDEISDQPELTFNFKDSSLVPLSRSSSEESLLPYDVTHVPENGTSDGMPFPTGASEETTASDSAFSDVSSKPQDPPPPSRKSAGKVPSTPKWKMESGRTSTASTKFPLSSAATTTTHNSRLQQPKSLRKIPSPTTDLVKRESTTMSVRPSVPPKFTSTPKVQQARPRVSSIDKRTIPKAKLDTPVGVKGYSSTTPSVTSSQKGTRASAPISTVKKREATKTDTKISDKPPRKSLSFRASSSCSTTSNEEQPPPPPLLHKPLGPVVSCEILEEIVEDFSGMKEALVDLQMALEEYQRTDAEKDKIIASLQAEVSSLQTRKCSCGRRLRYTSGGSQEDLDLEVFERDEESVLEESVIRGSIFSDCLTDADSPEKRATSFISSDQEERDKLGQLVSFRAGGRRAHGHGHSRPQNLS